MKNVRILLALGLLVVGMNAQAAYHENGWVYYDSGVSITSYSASFWGVVFPADESEGIMTKVKVFLKGNSHYNQRVIMRISEGSMDVSDNRVLKHYQLIDPPETDGWLEIVLRDPVTFSPGTCCWITFATQDGQYVETPATADNGHFNASYCTVYLDEIGHTVIKTDGYAFMIRALFASAQNLEANDITSTSARLTWEGNAERYDIKLTPDHIIRNVSGTEYTLTDLLPETNYDVTVAPHGAIDEGGSIIIPSEYLATTSFTTLPGPIDPTVETDGWVYYDTGIKAANIGIGDNLIYWGIMIPGGTVEATHLTKVSAYAPHYGDLTVYIYQGGETPAEGDLLHQQDISWEDIGSFQEAKMTPVVSIDPSQDLWIVLGNTGHINQPAAYCNIENAHHARWICTSDATGNYAWHNMQELYPYHCQLAWMIRGLFSSETGIEEIVDGRSSLVDGQKILHEGNLYILRDGKIFNAQGARVK